MSKRSINYKRNRKKPKRSSPGGTPGPFGRLQQKRDFSDIVKEISTLRPTNRLPRLNKKETSESSVVVAPTTLSKPSQRNLKVQFHPKLQSTAPLQTKMEKKAEKAQTQREAVTCNRSRPSYSRSPTHLTVKQRAQIFEAADRASTSRAFPYVQEYENQLDGNSWESIMQETRHRVGTPMPRCRRNVTNNSVP